MNCGLKFARRAGEGGGRAGITPRNLGETDWAKASSSGWMGHRALGGLGQPLKLITAYHGNQKEPSHPQEPSVLVGLVFRQNLIMLPRTENR